MKAAFIERILVVDAAHQAALGTVRHLPGLRCATAPDDSRLWLRGLPPDGPLPLPVRQLPALATYALDGAGRLFLSGAHTPVAILAEELRWLPIRAFVPLQLPTAALPGQLPPPALLQLVPTLHSAPGAALLTTLEAWHRYAETAPAIRLQALRFAVAGPRRVLVLGAPLPPMPGLELWQHGQLLLPAGLGFESELVAELTTRQLNPTAGEYLLFGADAGWERVPAEALVPATRHAVRCTAAITQPHD